MVICQPTYSGGGQVGHQASVGISLSASDIVLCGVEVQGYSGNMIPFVMFNYQLTPHLSPARHY